MEGTVDEPLVGPRVGDAGPVTKRSKGHVVAIIILIVILAAATYALVAMNIGWWPWWKPAPSPSKSSSDPASPNQRPWKPLSQPSAAPPEDVYPLVEDKDGDYIMAHLVTFTPPELNGGELSGIADTGSFNAIFAADLPAENRETISESFLGGRATFHVGPVTVAGKRITVGGGGTMPGGAPGIVGLSPHSGQISGLPAVTTAIRATTVAVDLARLGLYYGGTPSNTSWLFHARAASQDIPSVQAASLTGWSGSAWRKLTWDQDRNVVMMSGSDIQGSIETSMRSLVLMLDTGTTNALYPFDRRGQHSADSDFPLTSLEFILPGGEKVSADLDQTESQATMTYFMGIDDASTSGVSILVGNQFLRNFVLAFTVDAQSQMISTVSLGAPVEKSATSATPVSAA